MSNPLDFSSSDDSDREEDEKKTEEPFQQQRHQINKQKVKNNTPLVQNMLPINLEQSTDTQTPIQNRYVFWFMHRGSHKGGTASLDSFEQALIPVASFQTVEDFWQVYNHIARAPTIQSSGQTTFHLFKNGIKPTWEDSNNSRGGAWTVRLPKGLAARFWEELLIAIVGEQFDVGNEICGAKLSVRFSEDVISLWNRNADNTEATEKIRDLMIRLMRIPAFIHIEYKRHELSLGDKSSTWNGQEGLQTNPSVGQGPQQTQPHNSFNNTGGRGGGSYHQGKGGGGFGAGGQGGPPLQNQSGQTSSESRWSHPDRSRRGDTSSMGGKGGSREWNKGGENTQGPPPVRDLNAKWR